MKENLIKRKERKVEEQQALRALAEDMLKSATDSERLTLEQEIEECQNTIRALLTEIRELKLVN